MEDLTVTNLDDRHTTILYYVTCVVLSERLVLLSEAP